MSIKTKITGLFKLYKRDKRTLIVCAWLLTIVWIAPAAISAKNTIVCVAGFFWFIYISYQFAQMTYTCWLDLKHIKENSNDDVR